MTYIANANREMLTYRHDGERGTDMNEKIIRVVEEHQAHGLTYTIVETMYEYGQHFVLLVDGEPGFHSTDLERVQKYMKSWM